MSFTRAKAALSRSRFADLRWVPETGSTNADGLAALAAAVAGRPGEVIDLVVVADHQSAGRGRLGRVWESPGNASLLMTVGTTRHVPDFARGLLLTALSLAAIEACSAVAGFTPRLKWPNDLVAVGIGDDGGDRKVAGVLAEALPLANGQVGAAVGIGVNCNWGSIPDELAGIATSLDLLTGAAIDREDLAVATVEGFSRRLDLLATDAGRAAVVMEATQHSATLGRDVRVEFTGLSAETAMVEGLALELDPDGALVVETEGGERHLVVVGDVIHLRPT